MDSITKLQDISFRLDHIESSGEWLSRVFAHKDSATAQAGALIAALAEDVRMQLLDLVTELEKQIVVNNRN